MATAERVASTLTIGTGSGPGRWLPEHSPPQSNPVGTLALTKKSRSGIFALISMLRGERVDAPIFAGRSASTDHRQSALLSACG